MGHNIVRCLYGEVVWMAPAAGESLVSLLLSFQVLMSIERRSFLRQLAGASLAVTSTALAAPRQHALPTESAPAESAPARAAGLHQLRRGGRIAVAAPASPVSSRDLDGFLSVCRSYGLEPVLGPNINRRAGYLSAPDQDRADEFMSFIEDPSIDAIVCGRGGYGVMRILPMLDYNAIREANKPIMGYSDITSLLIAVHQLSGITTYHGPVASSTFDDFTTTYVEQTLLDPGSSNQEDVLWSFTDDRVTTVQPGVGRGRITGGNLAMVVASLGTAYEVDTQGAILFLEEVNEEPYRIDRMLTQLWLAGKLQSCAGIALGNFKNCEAKGRSISGPSPSLVAVLKERTQDLGIPVVYGLPIGHVKSKLTVPLGAMAELHTTHPTLTIYRA